MSNALNVMNGDVVAIPTTRCINCSSEGFVLHENVRDYEFGIAGLWTIRKCPEKDCGLCWIDPCPREDNLSKLYSDYWTHAQDDDDSPLVANVGYESSVKGLIKKSLATLFFWRRDSFLSDYNYLSKLPAGRLLDVGCGSGDFLAQMAARGWDAVGIDFDQAAVANARRYAGVDARTGDLISQRFSESHFDAIFLGNVIEHLPNPEEVFAECYRILKPGGRLVMLTPNNESFGHGYYGKFWRGLEAPRHLFLFNCRVLKAFAYRAKFRRVRVFTTSGPLPAAQYIIDSSSAAVLSEMNEVPKISALKMVLVERLSDLLGRPRGEWSVLIASKTAL